MSVNTISLIRKLSESDAIDFANALGWINPIPDTAEDIIDRLNNAEKRLNYMEGRQGNSEEDIEFAQQELAVVTRLKAAVTQILIKHES